MLPEPDADRSITAVLVRYATAIDTKDWVLLGTCFHPSCTFAGRGGTLRLDGAAAVVSYMEAAHQRIDGSMHRLSNIAVEVDADGLSASATSYLDALIVHRGHPHGPTFQLAAIYRDRFQPSAELDKPYVMVGVMGAVSETDEEAQYHFTSAQQQFVNLRRNVRGPFPRPVKDMDAFWSPMEKMNVEHTLRYAVVGSPETAEAKLSQFIKDTEADEVIISMPIHDIEARLRSVELFATLPSFKKVS